MRVRDSRMLALLAFLAMVCLLVQVLAGPSEHLALFAPALLVALPLLVGRYVGEDALERLRVARAVPAPSRRRAAAAPRLRPVARAAVRGGVLIGTHLSRRPPPALA